MCSVSEMSWFVGFVCRVLGDALVGEGGGQEQKWWV